MRNIKQSNLAANVSPTMLTCKKKKKNNSTDGGCG